jgi:hypothetical protein
MKNIILTIFALLSMATMVHALSITPTTPLPFKTGADYPTGNQNNNDIVTSEITLLNLGATLLYKQNVGGAEEGVLRNSYNTDFFNSPLDPSGASISYTGGNLINDPQYLLVKDGNHNPWWYLFDLTNLWNGTETLELSGFWPNQGAISYVALYGTSAAPVPEPGTIVLLGAGFLGLAVFGRKRIKK